MARLQDLLARLGLPATMATAEAFVNPGFLEDPVLTEQLLASGLKVLENSMPAAGRAALDRERTLTQARRLLAMGFGNPGQGVCLETMLSFPSVRKGAHGMRGESVTSEQLTDQSLALIVAQSVAGWALLEGYGGEVFKRIENVRAGDNSDQSLSETICMLGVWAKVYEEWAKARAESGLGLGDAVGTSTLPGSIGNVGGMEGSSPRIVAGPGLAMAQYLSQNPEAFIASQGGRREIVRLLAVLAETGSQASSRGRAAMLAQVPLLQRHTDSLFAFRHFALFSGLATQLKRVAGDVASALMTRPERQKAVILGAAAVPGIIANAPLGRPGANLRGLVDASFTALGYASQARTIRTIEKEGRPAAVSGQSGQSGPAQSSLFDKGLESLNFLLVEPSSWSQDVPVDIGGGQEFLRTVRFGAELTAQAFLKVEMDNAARAAVDKPVLEGQDFHQAVSDLADNPTRDMLITALDAARSGRFEADVLDPELSALAEDTLLGRVIAPLEQTVSGLISPWGNDSQSGSTGPLPLLSARLGEELASSGADRDLAVSRLALGGLVASACLQLAAAGYVTGSGPAGAAEKALWLKAGFTPQSFRVRSGGNWHSYARLGEPLATILTWAGDFVRSCADADRSAFENNRALTAMVLAVSKHAMDQGFVKSTADFVNFVLAGESASEGDEAHQVARFISSQAASQVSGGLSRFVNSADPETKLAQAVMDAWLAQSPGLSSGAPQNRDLWGNPLPGAGMSLWQCWNNPEAMRKAYASGIDREIAALGLNESPAARRISLSGVDVELTPEESSRYRQIAGQHPFVSLDGVTAPLKQALAWYIHTPAYRLLRASDPAQAAANLTERIQNTYAQARFMLLDETPRLKRLVAARKGRVQA